MPAATVTEGRTSEELSANGAREYLRKKMNNEFRGRSFEWGDKKRDHNIDTMLEYAKAKFGHFNAESLDTALEFMLAAFDKRGIADAIMDKYTGTARERQ